MLEGQPAPPQLGLVITRLVLCWLPAVPHCQALHCDQVVQELTRQFTDEQLRRLQDWLSFINIKVARRKIKALIGFFGSITDPYKYQENIRDSSIIFFSELTAKKTSLERSDTTRSAVPEIAIRI